MLKQRLLSPETQINALRFRMAILRSKLRTGTDQHLAWTLPTRGLPAAPRRNRTLCVPRGFHSGDGRQPLPRPRARTRWGDGGIEGDVYPRRELEFDPARSKRAVGPEATPRSPGRYIPLDPPIPLSQGPRATRRSGDERSRATKRSVPIWPIPRFAPPMLPWRCSPRERSCSRRNLALGTIPLVRACS